MKETRNILGNFLKIRVTEGRRPHGESPLFLLDKETGSVTLFPGNPVTVEAILSIYPSLFIIIVLLFIWIMIRE